MRDDLEHRFSPDLSHDSWDYFIKTCEFADCHVNRRECCRICGEQYSLWLIYASQNYQPSHESIAVECIDKLKQLHGLN